MGTHHTLINGTAYAITGGTDLVNGTKYQIGGVERWSMGRFEISNLALMGM